ncbi:unnamed protein product [Oncorhynchus mykiss]|uniref:Uncharacterized protein n=1 Tax=Oncorhynchus mykiss TaxID=8022 RepID=A0A060VV32_ONCMY|nr:unnamed protein product [Oncorhynchus mykiss]
MDLVELYLPECFTYHSDTELLGRMSVRGLDPPCPPSIKHEPSSPSSQGDSPAQPSPGGSSSDTNSSYGPLGKGHNRTNGLDSQGLYGHKAGMGNNGTANRRVFVCLCVFLSVFVCMYPFVYVWVYVSYM